MRSAFTILIILIFLAIAFFSNAYLQKIIRPRASFSRLLLYFISMLVMILLVSTLMVFLITWIFPGEKIR